MEALAKTLRVLKKSRRFLLQVGAARLARLLEGWLWPSRDRFRVDIGGRCQTLPGTLLCCCIVTCATCVRPVVCSGMCPWKATWSENCWTPGVVMDLELCAVDRSYLHAPVWTLTGAFHSFMSSDHDFVSKQKCMHAWYNALACRIRLRYTPTRKVLTRPTVSTGWTWWDCFLMRFCPALAPMPGVGCIRVRSILCGRSVCGKQEK